MVFCYLTIDDSPSERTGELVDYLISKNTPALLFIHGGMVEQNGTDALVKAVKKGFVLGNHMMSHGRTSEMVYEDVIAEIESVDAIINEIYATANVKRHGHYIRFPHMDIGTGGYIVDYNKIPAEYKDYIMTLFGEGVRVEMTPPTAEQIILKDMIENYLAENGYSQPFPKVTHPWYRKTEMAQTRQCLYTFSSSDWMVLDRHSGQWRYKSIEDLKQKMDDDTFFGDDKSASILLMHDDRMDSKSLDIFKSLIDHMLSKGYEFLSYDN